VRDLEAAAILSACITNMCGVSKGCNSTHVTMPPACNAVMHFLQCHSMSHQRTVQSNCIRDGVTASLAAYDFRAYCMSHCPRQLSCKSGDDVVAAHPMPTACDSPMSCIACIDAAVLNTNSRPLSTPCALAHCKQEQQQQQQPKHQQAAVFYRRCI
jgi:hypothetical protein